MSSPTRPLSATPSPSPGAGGCGPRAMAAAARWSAELAVALTASSDRWAHLVRHVPGARWYLPLLGSPGVLDLDELSGTVPPDATVSAWLITWAPGTGLDLHDHGGSAGTLAVVAGELTERHTNISELTADGPASFGPDTLRRRRLGPGTLTTFGPDHVHEVRNDGLEPAVSIHVYAPGLTDMAFYDAPAGQRPGVRTHTTDHRELP
jgi:hypothetical protein